MGADGMIFIVLAVFIGWKVIKRTRFLRGTEVDLHSDLAEIEEYTEDVSFLSSFGICSMWRGLIRSPTSVVQRSSSSQAT